MELELSGFTRQTNYTKFQSRRRSSDSDICSNADSDTSTGSNLSNISTISAFEYVTQFVREIVDDIYSSIERSENGGCIHEEDMYGNGMITGVYTEDRKCMLERRLKKKA